ncbi:hypothetical protein EJ06DRAFT_501891 [Trichodelitschia bisporula]|uniref:Uncharacterized protein n=1 Tax=Trichodelitschia bisporula TaxID=703511 RepID=A0A6G1I9X7_9PEZI|nr:hypothetical protein EJ06DRAFT_501891 [Trichodelitschia bisporula]
MADRPATPPRPTTSSSSLNSDSVYDDAPDLTPRPRQRSPEATRSLTDRRPSSPAQSSDKLDTRGRPEKGVTREAATELNGTTSEKSPHLADHKIDAASMQDVNLEDG